MNINIAVAEATKLEHKKTFDELSDTKIEEIAASHQQQKEKNLKEQEMKVSDDRNATELKRTQESVCDQEHFLRVSASWTSARFRQIAEIIEISIRMHKHARDHFSKTNISLEQILVELDVTRLTVEKKNIGHAVEIVKVC